jgi:hypothetical protein
LLLTAWLAAVTIRRLFFSGGVLMARMGRIPALAAVAWLTGAACCAAEFNWLQPPSPPSAMPVSVTQEMAVEESPPEWPAGTVEPEASPNGCDCTCDNPPGMALPAISLGMPDLSLTPPSTRTFGPGHPPPGTSWRNRPWYVGGFFGPLFGDDLRAGIDQDVGLIGGGRFGYDLDYYFAVESSVSFVSTGIDDGVTPPPGRHAESWYFDGSMVLYPWGDSQWRPFYAIGAGAAHFQFQDGEGAQYQETLFQLPLSVGVKYLYERCFAFRAELTHHVVFGGAGLNTMDNFAATAGFEIRYGVRPRSYFPW